MINDILKDTLKTVHDYVYKQGSAPDELPPLYITFFSVNSVTDRYDNNEFVTKWRAQTVIYGVDPVAVAELAERAREAAKNAHFIPIGKGNDLISGDPLYTGWLQEYYYFEKE